MQLDSNFSRYFGSVIVPESTALNVIISPESLVILAELAPSTSARVGNLRRLVSDYFHARIKCSCLQFCGLKSIMEVQWARQGSEGTDRLWANPSQSHLV